MRPAPDWRDRAEAIHKRRLARGASVGQPDADDPRAKCDADLPEPNSAFDYGADLAAFPFRWSPGDDWSLYREQLSHSDLGACIALGCDRLVRNLKPSSIARPLYCSACLEPNDAVRKLELEWVKVNGRHVHVEMGSGEVWQVGSQPADRDRLGVSWLYTCLRGKPTLNLPATHPVARGDMTTRSMTSGKSSSCTATWATCRWQR